MLIHTKIIILFLNIKTPRNQNVYLRFSKPLPGTLWVTEYQHKALPPKFHLPKRNFVGFVCTRFQGYRPDHWRSLCSEST